MKRTIAALTLLGLMIGGCSPGGDDDQTSSETSGPDTSSGATPPPDDAAGDATIDASLITIGDLLDEEGVLPLDAALQVFAATVAPIPGVESLDSGSGELAHGAGLAIRRMNSERGQLDESTLAVLDEVLAVAENADEASIVPGTARAREVAPADGPADPPDADELESLIGGVVGTFEASTGHALSIPIRALVVPERRTGGDAVTTRIGSGTRPSGCRILLPESLFGGDGASAMSTVAHEVWHCFQLDINPAAFDSGPEWIIEGQAEWAGEEYIGGSKSSAGSWNTWLLAPHRRLAGRSYDAIGLYGEAQTNGADPWDTMPAMLGQSGMTAVETLFGGSDAVSAVGEAAKALARVPAMGDEWESFGPGITGANAGAVLAVGEGDAQRADLTIGRFAALPVVLAVSGGDILRVGFVGGTSGAVAMPDSGTIAALPGGSVNLCMRPEGCVCPDGSDPFGAGALPTASYGEGAASLGGLEAGSVSITARTMTLEEACSSTLVGVWTMPVAETLAILTAPYGGTPMVCDGPFLVTFRDDGTWATGFDAACVLAETTGSATASLSGTYTYDEETFTVADIVGEGSMTIFEVTQPLPIVDGYRQGMGSTVPYSVTDDQLTYSYVAPDGNSFTFTLTRVE